jgi:hypothetical protein
VIAPKGNVRWLRLAAAVCFGAGVWRTSGPVWVLVSLLVAVGLIALGKRKERAKERGRRAQVARDSERIGGDS